jgi:nuclear transport factor 2 (NTF2) superfamily protein
MAEDGWNSRDPDKVSLAYSIDSIWRNRDELVNGRKEIVEFLKRKWTKELDYYLIEEMWAFTDNRIAVRFAYEWYDDPGEWFRSYGNENREFDTNGLMKRRIASINNYPIKESGRKYHCPLGRRPDNTPGYLISGCNSPVHFFPDQLPCELFVNYLPDQFGPECSPFKVNLLHPSFISMSFLYISSPTHSFAYLHHWTHERISL